MEHFNLVERLHTDVLEDKYGQISAKVLKHNRILREAHLIDARGISRTYALTFLNSKEFTNEIKKINNKIKRGYPIGKCFKEKKYSIRKNVIDVYKIKIPKWLQKDFDTKEHYAKARLSEFYARKERHAPLIYGTVIEIYSPDFRKASINSTDLKQINPLTREFEKIGISKERVWERIGKDNNWEDVKEKYKIAKTVSKEDVQKIKKQISAYLKH